MSLELVEKHFPDLTELQKEQFKMLGPLYEEWNEQINVISRKDIEHLYTKHVLHSLGIAKFITFTDGSEILDIGTGGGFPGIPLAILYPKVKFILVDSIGKKIIVVKEVAEALGLKNVKAYHERAENVKGQFDYVVSRAVTRMAKFVPWTRGKFKKKMKNLYPNGIIYLKGGDLKEELSEIDLDIEVFELSKVFEDEFFESKKVVYVKMT